MNPHEVWCPNLACPARGRVGHGTIGVHSQQEQRYRCTVCAKTFGARTGTIFHRRRTDEARLTQVITLISWGCPIVAVEHAYGIQAQTVRAWLEAAGHHAEAVHRDQVLQPRDLGHVQADEVRVKTQCGIVWMAMAMMVATRLWLGGTISTRRDQRLITRLVALIAAAAVVAPLLLLVDGFASYIAAFRLAFRTRERTGKRGAPRKVPWPDLCWASGHTTLWATRGGGHAAGGPREEPDGGPLAEGDAGVLGADHGVETAGERNVSGAVGAGGAPDASFGASEGDAARRDVSGERAVHLLHVSSKLDGSEWRAADASDGDWAHRSLLDRPGPALEAGAAATLGAAQPARPAVQGHATPD